MLRSRLHLDVSQVRQATRQAAEDMKRLSREGRKSATEASGAWEKAGSRIGAVLSRLKGLIAAAFAVESIRRFVSSIIDINVAMGDLEDSFATFTGGAREAKAVLAEIEELSRHTPIRFQELAKAGRELLAMRVATPDTLVDTLKTITDAASALQPDNVVGAVDAITTAFARLEMRGKLSTNNLMRLEKVGIDVFGTLARVTGKSTQELQELTSKGLMPASEIIAALKEGMRDFAGSAERASRTFSARIGIIKDEVERVLRDVGKLFFDELERDVGSLAGALSELRQSPEFEKNVRLAAQALKDLYGILKTLAPLVLRLTPTLAKLALVLGTVKLARGVVSGFNALRAAWIGLAGAGATLARTLASMRGIIRALGGWPAVFALAIGAVASLIIRLRHFDSKLAETTRKVRESADIMRDLAGQLSRALGAGQAGSLVWDIEVQMPDLQQAAEEALDALDARDPRMAAGIRAMDLNQLAAARRHFTWGDDDGRTPTPAVAELGRQAAETLHALKVAEAELEEAQGRWSESYEYQIAYLERQVEHMKGLAGTAAFDKAQLDAWEARLTELKRRRDDALKLDDDDSGDKKDRPKLMTLEEIRRQAQLLAMAEELRSKQEEIYRLQDQANAVEEELATATGARKGALEALLAALREEIALKDAALGRDAEALHLAHEEAAEAERLEALWESLPAHAQEMVGSMEELGTLLKSVDFEALGVDAAAFMGEVQGAMAALNEELESIRDRQAAGLIDEGQARKEAEAVKETYLRTFRDLFTRLEPLLESLPKGIADALRAALRELRDAVDGADSVDWERQIREVQSLTVAVIDLAHAFRLLDDDTAAALRSMTDLGAGIARIASGDLTGGLTQAIGGLAGFVSSLFTGSSRRKEEISRLSDSIKAQVQALRENTAALMESARIGADLTRAVVREAVEAVEMMQRGGGSRFARGLERLEGTGLPGTEGLTDLYKEAVELIRKRDFFNQGMLTFALRQAMLTGDFSKLPGYIQDLFRGFDGLTNSIKELSENLGRYSDTIGGAVERSRGRQQFLGLEGMDAYRDVFEGIGEGLEAEMSQALKDILEEMRRLDLTTAEGRRRFEELVAMAYNLGVGGMAGISAQDLEALLSHLQSTASGIEDPRDSHDTSKTVQSFRSITEYQADLLIGIQREALYVLRAIHSRLGGGTIEVPQVPDPSTGRVRALAISERSVRSTTSSGRTPSRAGESRPHVGIEINGLGVHSVDELMREIDRRVRSHPRLR